MNTEVETNTEGIYSRVYFAFNSGHDALGNEIAYGVIEVVRQPKKERDLNKLPNQEEERAIELRAKERFALLKKSLSKSGLRGSRLSGFFINKTDALAVASEVAKSMNCRRVEHVSTTMGTLKP